MAHWLDFSGGDVPGMFYLEQPRPVARPGMSHNNYAQESSSARRDAAFKSRSDTKRRRKRTTFTKAQLSLLETTFSVTQYPNIKIKECLADITGLPESKIQVWFQNRRARHFKSKKLKSSEVSRLHADLQPEFILNARGPQLDPGLPSPPGYPAPSLPQSSRLSTILNPSTSWHPRGSYQDHCSDFFDLCENVRTCSGLDGCCSDLDSFLGDGSQLQGSSAHPENKETLQQDLSSPQGSLEDLSDLDLQDLLGDFNPSDLDSSVAMMIDDLFGLNH